jgi:hypothetical protein
MKSQGAIYSVLALFSMLLCQAAQAQQTPPQKPAEEAKPSPPLSEAQKKLEGALNSKKTVIERCIKEFVENEKGEKATVAISVTITPEGQLKQPPTITAEAGMLSIRLKTCLEMRLGDFDFKGLKPPKEVTAGITHSYQRKAKEEKKTQEKEVKGSGVFGVPSQGFGGEKEKKDLPTPPTESNP